MGGYIWIGGEEGQGARFILSLPGATAYMQSRAMH